MTAVRRPFDWRHWRRRGDDAQARQALVDRAHELILTGRRGLDPNVLVYRASDGQQRVALLEHSRCLL